MRERQKQRESKGARERETHPRALVHGYTYIDRYIDLEMSIERERACARALAQSDTDAVCRRGGGGESV